MTPSLTRFHLFVSLGFSVLIASLIPGTIYAAPVVTLSGASTVTLLVGSGVVSSDTYTETGITNTFTTGGVAQGWRSDDTDWNYALPFDFTFYGVTYTSGTSIKVSSNGRICFDTTSPCNLTSGSLSSPGTSPSIAPLWRDLYTAYNPADDIYISSTADSVAFRWQATSCCGPDYPVNFSATIFRNGQIRFDYGSMPTPYTDNYQAIGITKGDGMHYIMSPKASLNSYNNITSSLFSGALVYNDPGASWTDTTDGSGFILKATTGSVDVMTLGTYILTYSYTNTLGSTTSITRTVIVAPPDTTAPVVSLIGSGTMTVNHGSTFTDPGASWTDNVDGSGSISVANSGSVNTGVVGTYILTYRKVDNAGNIGSTTRTVNVIDATPPVVTLVGSGTINITQGGVWSDSGATWTDNVDGSGTISVASSGSVNTGVVGTYILTYRKVDVAGNTGSTTRTVNILAPVITSTTGGGGGGGGSSSSSSATPVVISTPSIPVPTLVPTDVPQKSITQEVFTGVVATPQKKIVLTSATTLKRGATIIVYRTLDTGRKMKVGTTRVKNGTIQFSVAKKGNYSFVQK